MCDDTLPVEVLEANGCYEGTTTNAVPDIITNIVYSVIAVVGIVSVIYVVIGSIKYISSSGDPEKTKTAKKTILYALIGMIISALAFAIVNFTISRIPGNNPGNPEQLINDPNNPNPEPTSTIIRLLPNTQRNVNDPPFTLPLYTRPSTGDNPRITWNSSNPDVATVDRNGLITPHHDGTTTITAKTADGATASTEVTITPPILASSVTIPTGSLRLKKGDSQAITATVAPYNATNKAVTWSSSKKSVATINSQGVIKAKKKGTTTITAKTSNGVTASIKVTVTKKKKKNKSIKVTKKLLKHLKRYHQNNYGGMSVSCDSDVGDHSCGTAAYLAGHYVLTGKDIDYLKFAEEGCGTYYGDVMDFKYFLYKKEGRSKYEKKYGVKLRHTTMSWDNIVKQLKKGKVIINFVVEPSIFAGCEHFVTSIAYREKNGGEIYVWNPNSSRASGWYNKKQYTKNAMEGLSVCNGKGHYLTPYTYVMSKTKK